MSEESAPVAVVIGTRLSLRWLPFGLGALAGIAWVGAVLQDPWRPVAGVVPVWLHSGLHVMLVLAVPTLIVLVLRPLRLPPAYQRARTVVFVVVEMFLL